jgi:hypothetical protein
LSEVISQCPGVRRVDLTPSAGRREQEIDEHLLRKLSEVGFVAQHHVRNSEWTAEMCRSYRVTPIVLVRSLQDVVVSLRDHMRHESAVFPQFFADSSHAALDDAALELMIARLALPWYLNFYMSWRGAPGAMMVSYENLVESPAEVIGEILSFSGGATSDAEVKEAMARAIARGDSRLNVGVTSRGASLQPETVQTILDLIDLYPEAASDPYIRSVRAQGLATLAGAATPKPQIHRPITLPRPSGLWSGLRKRDKRLMVHWVLPAALVILGLSYWIWPNDLIPDNLPYGHLDDATVMLVSSFLAGVLRYKKI